MSTGGKSMSHACHMHVTCMSHACCIHIYVSLSHCTHVFHMLHACCTHVALTSLNMLQQGGNTDLPEAPVVNFDNCEPFFETLQVSWSVDTDNSEVDFQICSCRPLDAGYGVCGR